MISLPALRRLSAGALIGSLLVGCGGGGDGGGGCGIVSPTRSITSSPASLAVDVGKTTTSDVVFTTSCASDSRVVTVTSSNTAVATVSLSGTTATVTGVAAGTTTLTLSATAGPTTNTVAVTVRPLVPTTLTLTPANDTLSPLGTRQLTSAVRDQNGAALTTATVVWRSLTTAVANVSASGLVTASANGTATIQAKVATGTGTDSLTASTTIQVVAPCTRLRPIGFAATYSGVFDASSCRNFLGFTGVLDQFTVTAAAQTTYSIRMAPSFVGSLVPLTVGSAFFGIAPTDTAVTNIVVVRPGTFGFIVASTTQNPGTYTITTALNPDPRQSCVGTDVTRGVSFVTGLTPTCQARNIRVLPLLNNTARIIATATSPSFPVRIDLLEFGTNTTLATVSATINGGTATLNYLNTADRFVYFRVFGPPSANDNVTITIDQ